eukprot:1160176-Pelagomonas_calceolata.AAC.7
MGDRQKCFCGLSSLCGLEMPDCALSAMNGAQKGDCRGKPKNGEITAWQAASTVEQEKEGKKE